MQADALDAPTTADANPGAHGVHELLPEVAEYVPAAHGAQDAGGATAVPLGQAAAAPHAAAPAALNKPPGQSVQLEPAVANFPAAQGVHTAEPAGALVPAVHIVQLVEPVAL